MAIIGTDEDTTNPNGQPGQAPSQTGGVGAGTVGSGAAYVGGGGQGATTAVAPSTQGSGYTNLQSYLNANQGGGQVNGQAAANVVKQSSDAANAAQQTYKNDVSGAIAGGLNGASYSGPTGSTSGGVTSLSGLNSQGQADQAAVNSANQDVASKATQAGAGMSGVGSLLRDAYTANPTYSQGENSLDAFLAGGTTGGRAALGQATGMGSAAANNYAGIQAALAGQAQDQVASPFRAAQANINTKPLTQAVDWRAPQNVSAHPLTQQIAPGPSPQDAFNPVEKPAQVAANGYQGIMNTIGNAANGALPAVNSGVNTVSKDFNPANWSVY